MNGCASRLLLIFESSRFAGGKQKVNATILMQVTSMIGSMNKWMLDQLPEFSLNSILKLN